MTESILNPDLPAHADLASPFENELAAIGGAAIAPFRAQLAELEQRRPGLIEKAAAGDAQAAAQLFTDDLKRNEILPAQIRALEQQLPDLIKKCFAKVGCAIDAMIGLANREESNRTARYKAAIAPALAELTQKLASKNIHVRLTWSDDSRRSTARRSLHAALQVADGNFPRSHGLQDGGRHPDPNFHAESVTRKKGRAVLDAWAEFLATADGPESPAPPAGDVEDGR